MASKAAASGGDAAASPAGGGIAGSGFTVVISGQLESGRALGYDSLSAEYFFEAGPDWTRVDGIATGVTQTAFRGGGGASREAVWGMPLDVAYRTTNAYGWPRIGVAVSAIDALGRPVIVGYGSVLVPLAGSGHTRRIRLFAPVSSTLLQRFFAWVTANPPRYWKPNIVTQGTGREVTRVASSGSVTVTLNVVTRGMTRHGYNAGTEPDSLPAEFVAAGMSSAPGLPGSIGAVSSGPAAAAAAHGPASTAGLSSVGGGGGGLPAPSPLSRSVTGGGARGPPGASGTWQRSSTSRPARTGSPLTGRPEPYRRSGSAGRGGRASGAAPRSGRPGSAADGAEPDDAKQAEPDDEGDSAPASKAEPDDDGDAGGAGGAGGAGEAPAPAPARRSRDSKGVPRSSRGRASGEEGTASPRGGSSLPPVSSRSAARRGSDASAGSGDSRRSRGGSALGQYGGASGSRRAMGHGTGGGGGSSMDL
uniref:B9 domain-containing protein 1 n=1 Tax=Cafeteria roenbergensis TaxID=33653 RepID=A0A7S0PF52_CAFRO|mmetsp:Transcript_4925/g.21077  ORF Transcript_4925/g.21077 Transcript_4925/m.21077 type:complete len:476 (+) Transcript_4925:190-1617(+)